MGSVPFHHLCALTTLLLCLLPPPQFLSSLVSHLHLPPLGSLALHCVTPSLPLSLPPSLPPSLSPSLPLPLPLQVSGDQELIRNSDKLWWFGQTFRNREPHQMTSVNLLHSMKLNREFAKVIPTHISLPPSIPPPPPPRLSLSLLADAKIPNFLGEIQPPHSPQLPHSPPCLFCLARTLD